MRWVEVKGWSESYEARDKTRARITLRVITLGDLSSEETPYRVRVTLSAASGRVGTGEAIGLRATLRPPPEPIEPHGFDFARTAWFERVGASGYATAKITRFEDVGESPWDLRLWVAIDHLRSSSMPASARASPVSGARSPQRSSPASGPASPRKTIRPCATRACSTFCRFPACTW
jgi:competence protein ComEC